MLPWLRQLQSAGLVEPSPRMVVDVERLLRLRERWVPDELGVCLASLLAHDEVSWRQIEESFREWRVDQQRSRLPPERQQRPAKAPRSVEPGVVPPPRRRSDPRGWTRHVPTLASWWRWIHRLTLTLWGWLTRLRWFALIVVGITLALVLSLVGAQELFQLDRELAEEAAEVPAAAWRASQPSTEPPSRPLAPTHRQIEARFDELEPAHDGRSIGNTFYEEPMSIEPWWATIGMLLASLSLVVLAGRCWTSIELHSRRRAQTAKLAEQDRMRRLASAKQIATPYHIKPRPPLSPEVIEAAATLLARLTEDRPGRELDVEPTIERTIDAGGRLDPVLIPSRQHVHLLVLVDVETGDHPDLHRVEQLLAQWRRGGLAFVRYDFEHQPGQVRAHAHAPPHDLATLASMWETTPLLVVSRWIRPEDYAGRIGWLGQLAAWPNRAWLDLDPRPVQERSPRAVEVRTAVVRSGLPRFAFTEVGLEACARTLASRGEHAAPVDDPAGVDLDALDPKLELWAACACLVPDPTWQQLQALRLEIAELREVFGQGGDTHRLIEWVQRYAARHPPTGPEDDDVSPRVLGHGERLLLPLRCRHALKAALRRYDDRTFRRREDRVEYRARALLVEQLLAADVRGDDFEKLKRDLKVSAHRAVMDRREAHTLLVKFGHTAVARELQELVIEEKVLQREGLHLGGKWLPAVVEGLHGRFGSNGAYLRDLLHPRPWSWTRLGMSGVLVAVGVSYGAWWITRSRVLYLRDYGTQRVVIPARYRVMRVEAIAAECDQTSVLVDAAPMTLKCLPGGSFTMGTPATEEGNSDERPQHEATVMPFAIGIHEVTVAQWRTVMDDNPSDCRSGCDDDHPVQNVSWYDSVQFLNELSKRENLTPCYREQGGEWAWIRPCEGYRLPTETEWEYAARAMSTTAYGFGSDSSKLEDHAWYDKNSGHHVHAVGIKKANAWGLHDMHGNVYEWVWDRYGEYPSERTSEGYAGPDEGDDRVLRGGSFDLWRWGVRSGDRTIDSPMRRREDYGLRCARSLSAELLNDRAQRNP